MNSNLNLSKVIVSVRIRPLVDGENDYSVEPLGKKSLILSKPPSRMLYHSDYLKKAEYTFDYIHWSTNSHIDLEYATQNQIFNDIGEPLVQNLINGKI